MISWISFFMIVGDDPLLDISIFPDVSTTMIIQPGAVADFLIANQNVRDPFSVDWAKVIRHPFKIFF